MDWTIFAIILQLIFLEGILSIDNAAVLGAMVSVLPEDKKVEWPRALRRLGKIIDPLVGKERTAALRVGLLGAYVGRGMMLVLASLIIQNPWLKLLGAFYLIHLAFENLGMPEEGEEEQFNREQRARGFWMVVLNVELADLVFSLDNVVASVSLSNKIWVVIVGVAIGMLGMRFAAGLFTKAILKEPILQSAAYILVLNIGVQLILEDLGRLIIPDMVRFAISLVIIFVSLLYAHSRLFQKIRPILVWLAQGMDNINELINWILVPVRFFLRTFLVILKAGFGKPVPKRLDEFE